MKDVIVKNLKKSFGEKQVLRDFSAVFKAGETTTVMGSSGCGKTTLLNLFMGFLSPDSGEISGIPDRKSAVFQEDRLCEAFHAVANIRMVMENPSGRAGKGPFGGNSDQKALQEEIEGHLRSLGIDEDCFYKPVREFSGGMKRRVAIARAVLFGGDILFLDEPFKGLDGDTKKLAISYVKEHTKGRTVIFVTHDREEAAQMGGSLIRMDRVAQV